jgi:hypothetical protein
MKTYALTIAVTFVLGVSTLAAAQAQEGLSIANNDSVYIDGKSFKIIPGKAKVDISAGIKELDARALGPAAIIFRSGDKLYIADAAPPVHGQNLGDRNAVYGQNLGDRNAVYGQNLGDRNAVYGQNLGDRNAVYGQNLGDRNAV